jgi:lipopolysaccharide export system permease protein
MSQGRRYDGLPTEGDFQMMQFEKYSVLVSTQSKLDADNRSAKALPLSTLLENPNPTRDGELLWRVSLPFMGLFLMLLAIPLGYVNPRVGRSANLIAALIFVSINITMLNMLQMAVVNGRLSFWRASWPMHFLVATLVTIFFLWRLKVNSRLHPSGLWSRFKACFRSERRCDTALPKDAGGAA